MPEREESTSSPSSSKNNILHHVSDDAQTQTLYTHVQIHASLLKQRTTGTAGLMCWLVRVVPTYRRLYSSIHTIHRYCARSNNGFYVRTRRTPYDDDDDDGNHTNKLVHRTAHHTDTSVQTIIAQAPHTPPSSPTHRTITHNGNAHDGRARKHSYTRTRTHLQPKHLLQHNTHTRPPPATTSHLWGGPPGVEVRDASSAGSLTFYTCSMQLLSARRHLKYIDTLYTIYTRRTIIAQIVSLHAPRATCVIVQCTVYANR